MGTYFNSYLVLSAAATPGKASTTLDSPGLPVTIEVETAINLATDQIYVTVDTKSHASSSYVTRAILREFDFRRATPAGTAVARVRLSFASHVQVEIHSVSSSTPTTNVVVSEFFNP